MTDEKKEMKIVFAPGCFDDFDGTQEELDEFVAELQRLVESGEIFEKSTPVDIDELLDEMSDEEVEEFLNEVESENTTPRTLQ